MQPFFIYIRMQTKKLAGIALMLLPTLPTLAGGILTNTNQNIAFNRNFARDGVIAIDGVYSNPAGVAFLPKGFHLSLNNQSAFQTRTILSGMTLLKPASLSYTDEQWQQTPYYHPLSLNGGDANGVKEYKGEASAPIIPSVQAALNYDNWGFQFGFALVGGGGKCTFNRGLGSFERQIALLPAMLQQTNLTYQQKYGLDLGLGSDQPSYSVESYIHGQQYVFGAQFGATYKFNEHLAVYGGFRFNYIYNKYKGSIKNITVNIAGANENLYNYLGTKAELLATQATTYKEQAAQYALLAEQAQLAGNTAAAEQYSAASQKLTQGAALAGSGAQAMEGVRDQVADKELDCTQRGWAITPIIGVDYRFGKLNLGARLEFTTHFNIENDTKVDDTGLFTDGVNTPADQPGIFSLGAQYDVLPQWRVMASYHYYFDKDARMDKDKQKLLSANTQEYALGTEYDITKNLMVSAGVQRTKYGLGDGSFLNDMSFVTSSYSVGFGAAVRVAKNVKVNVAYFWTNYEHFKKEYTQTYSAAGQEVQAINTDDFTRTNKVFGVGVDIDF